MPSIEDLKKLNFCLIQHHHCWAFLCNKIIVFWFPRKFYVKSFIRYSAPENQRGETQLNKSWNLKGTITTKTASHCRCAHTTVWKLLKFTHSLLWQKFRENNNNFNKELISRNFFSVIENFWFFHIVHKCSLFVTV